MQIELRDPKGGIYFLRASEPKKKKPKSKEIKIKWVAYAHKKREYKVYKNKKKGSRRIVIPLLFYIYCLVY